jgi:outer membrane protein OmpA-like peptidoglycan-associated protein
VAAAQTAASTGSKSERDAGGTYEEQRAHELYLDATEKLDAGQPAWAEDAFETLIARFPNTAAATLARRQLDALYGGEAVGATDKTAEVPPGKASISIGSSPLWDQELRRNASIQDKFRSEAGDRVFFSAGSAELGSRARTALATQAQWLIRWREFEAAIEGHADESGSDDDNLKLSEKRAEAVRQRLVDEGVEASRLAIVAQGRTQRIATCSEPECLAQNRRVVTLVFASGTSERLGLGAAPAQAALDQRREQSLGPAQPTRNPAAATEVVGVPR